MRRPLNPRLARYAAMLGPDRLGGQTVAAFGLKIVNAATSFALSLLVARRFGAAGSGHFGIAVTTVTILSYLVLAGLDYTVVRTAAGDLREGKRGAARGAVRAAGTAVALIAPVTIGILWLSRETLAARLLGQPGMASLLAVMLWAVVPLALQRIASAALRASGRAIASQVVDGPLGTGVAVAALATLVLTGGATTLLVPAWCYLGGLATGSAAGWLTYRRTVSAWPPAERTALVPLVLAGLPVVALNLSNAFTEWYTTVSLGTHWPAAVAGQYRAAWQFVAIAGLVQTAMDTMIGPRIAAAARVGEKREIASIARKSILLVLLLGGPLFLMLVLFPEPLLGIFGPGFRGGATALQILAVGQLVRLASGPLGSILFMTGHQRWQLIYAAAGVALCIGLVAWLVPLYGAVGAALATGATVILRNLAAGLIVHRIVGINLFSRR